MRKTNVNYVYIRPVISNIHKEGNKIPKNIIEEIKTRLKFVRLLENKKFKIFINDRRIESVLSKKKTYKACLSTPLIGVIGADGNIYLCCQWRGNEKYIIGNVFEKPFKEIWGSRRHKKIIKKIKLDTCPPCRNDVYNSIIEECFINDKLQKKFL